jgi:hypothetical protein
MADPCVAANQKFIDYYNANAQTSCNLDNQTIGNRDEYCSKCIPEYESLLSTSSSACGAGLDANIAHNYDFVRFAKQYFCSKDSATGEYCDQVSYKGFNYQIPYSQWDSSLCTSSCVGQIDQGIREVLSNSNLLINYGVKVDLFSGNGNPVSSCPGASAAGATAGAATGATGAAGAAGAAGANGAAGTAGTTGTTGTAGAANGVAGTTNGINGATGTTNNTLSSKATLTNLNTNSGANSLSANVCLLSLLICLIMAYLK